MSDDELSIAEKHIQISVEVARYIKELEMEPYVATYTAGRSGPKYVSIQKRYTNIPFCNIRLFTKEKKREYFLKAPDLIACKDNMVKYVIEVKWGFINLGVKSDLWTFLQSPEHTKFIRMINETNFSLVKLPGDTDEKKIPCDERVKYCLVSDFHELYQNNIDEFHMIIAAYNASPLKGKLVLLDYARDVDGIQSLDLYLKGHR